MPSKWALEQAHILLLAARREPEGWPEARGQIADAADEAEKRGRDSVLAQLKNPDEAMHQAIDRLSIRTNVAICRAIADHLAKQGGDDGH